MRSIPAREIIYQKICDEMLWINFINGDRDAFSLLYYRHFKNLIKHCLTISQDKELIKDCIHDLFLNIWKNRLKLGHPQSVKAYLVRSAQRKIIRQLQKSRALFKKERTICYYEAGVVHSIEKQIISEQLLQERKKNVIKALDTLTKRQKEAVYLKFYADLSYPEIAGKMAISTDSTYNLISKAIDNMHYTFSQKPLPTF